MSLAKAVEIIPLAVAVTGAMAGGAAFAIHKTVGAVNDRGWTAEHLTNFDLGTRLAELQASPNPERFGSPLEQFRFSMKRFAPWFIAK